MSSEYPTISIVTPTFNSAAYLEACIQSLLEQDYPALEHIIMDGGSTDGTLDIIQRYADHLAYWVSEPDNGMYDAIQKGFAQATGTIMAWLNSDDLYLPWTLHLVRDIFVALPELDWITSIRPLLWDGEGRATDCMALPGYSRRGFWHGEHMPGSPGYVIESIQQESTFWRRSLWERAGGRVDTSLKLAGDFELWARFYQHSDLTGVRAPLGGFRVHATQLSARHRATYYAEAQTALRQHGGRPHSRTGSLLRRHLAPLVPRRARPLAARLGLCYRARNCVYDQEQQSWKLRTAYI